MIRFQSVLLSASAMMLSFSTVLSHAAPSFSQDAVTLSTASTPQRGIQSSAYDWVATGKNNRDEVAHLQSTTQAEHMEIHFFNHEFGSVVVCVPGTVQVKDHSKNAFTQLKKNKIDVTLTFNNEAPVIQAWGILDFPKENSLPMLTPQDRSPKFYQKALKSKKLVMSYPDANGNVTTVSFDLSAMQSQMDEHKEHIHHFGFKDAATILEGFSAF